MGSQQNRSSSRLAWFFTGFFILVVGIQIFLGFAYNISSTPPTLIIFNGLITLITFALALFQVFPGGMQSFFVSLHIADLGKMLRRKALIIVLSLILIISLSFNLSLVLQKTPTRASSLKSTPSAASTSPFPTSTATPSVSFSMDSLQEFQIPTPNSRPVAFIRGPDGNFWFTEEQGNKIGRITPQGQVTEFLIPTLQCIPGGLVRGSDRNLWFYENKGDKIGRITLQGQITEFPVPTRSDLVGITAGPDGNLWFVGFQPNKIWRMTTSGTITGAFPIPTNGSGTETIMAGPDGNVWFVEDWGNKIGRITPQGSVTEFPIPTPLVPGQQNYHDLTVGPDGNLWFTEGLADKIGRITPQGEITEFTVPPPGGSPSSPFAGLDSNLWFIDDANHIRRITPSGIFLSALTLNPPATSRPYGLAMGQENTIWFIEPFGNMIGRITPSKL